MKNIETTPASRRRMALAVWLFGSGAMVFALSVPAQADQGPGPDPLELAAPALLAVEREACEASDLACDATGTLLAAAGLCTRADLAECATPVDQTADYCQTHRCGWWEWRCQWQYVCYGGYECSWRRRCGWVYHTR